MFRSLVKKSPLALVATAAVLVIMAMHNNSGTLGALNKVTTSSSTTTTTTSLTTPRRSLVAEDWISPVGLKQQEANNYWKNDLNVVHVVNTRFMQHQATLKHLGQARLDLFQTLTVPSLKQQSNQQFLWIVWTDPDLSEDLKHALIQATRDVPQVLIVARREGPVKGMTLREQYGLTDLSTHDILAGQANVWNDYVKASRTRVLVETTLDADDALSRHFVDSVQGQAAAAVGHGEHARPGTVEHYCPAAHLEWRYYGNSSTASSTNKNNKNVIPGTLVLLENHNFCIASGLTTVSHVPLWDAKQAKMVDQRRMHSVTNCNIEQEHAACFRERSLSDLFHGNHQRQLKPPFQMPTTPSVETLDACEDNSLAYTTDPNVDRFPSSHQEAQTSVCPLGTSHCKRVDGANELFFGSSFAGVPIGQSFTVQCEVQGCNTPDVLTFGVTTVGYQEGTAVNQFDVHYQGSQSGNDYGIGNGYVKTGGGNCNEFPDKRSNWGVNHLWYDPQGNTGALVHSWTFSTECGKELSHFRMCAGRINGLPPDACSRRLKLLPTIREDQQQHDQSKTITPLDASVLMARTPTAAGMKNVMPGQKGGGVNSRVVSGLNDNDKWKTLDQEFGVSSQELQKLHARMEGDMKKILVDAFAGQCTKGHSCKQSTKRALGYLLDKVYHHQD